MERNQELATEPDESPRPAQGRSSLLSDGELLMMLDAIDAYQQKATEGPYFVAADSAHDCPDHKDSGLALIDTGRSGDWPIARLCEWPTAHFLVAVCNAWPTISYELRNRPKE